jgi:molybdopterin molybdotransferase
VLKPSLVTIEDARAAVLAEISPLPPEPVPADEALGRVSAEAIIAGDPVPPFDNSAMDGYAVRVSDAAAASPDTPIELPVAGESRAGHPWPRPIDSPEAVAISTGAVLPDGADAVVRLEDTRSEEGRVTILNGPAPGLNVRRAGDDLPRGATALAAGTIIGPAELGVLASVGRSAVECHARPSLTVLVTGDELAAPDEQLAPGQIHDTNSHTIPPLARLAGARVVTVDHVEDEPGAVRAALERSLAADVAVICGGVSVGQHDHVREALRDLGVEERFWGVALKPGKPTAFGVRDGAMVFGLPGNPVSAVVTFLLLVRPALLALVGRTDQPARSTAILDEDYPKTAGRAHAVRCRLEFAGDGWHVSPTKDQGSHVLSSLLGADCLALLPTEAEDLAAGSRVEIELLPETPLAGKMEGR